MKIKTYINLTSLAFTGLVADVDAFFVRFFNIIIMKETCLICGQYKKIRIPNIAISFGTSGEYYNICYKCSKELNVDQFFRKLANKLNYAYPLKLKNDG